MLTRCVECEEDFFRRIDKKQDFCSEDCYWKNKTKRNHISLQVRDIEVINGLLLSDGSISKTANSKNCYFTFSSAEAEFAEYGKSLLSFDTNIMSFKSRKTGRYTSRGCFEVKTKTSDTFTEMRGKWYPNDKKAPPEDLLLTPLTVLMWFLGDGSLDNSKGAIFCTDAFSVSDNENLISKLKNAGIGGYLAKKRNRIIIPNRYVYELFVYIGTVSPVMCYAHKWDSIVKESYFGRRCECGGFFDAVQNHQKWCSEKCYKKFWKIRNNWGLG